MNDIGPYTKILHGPRRKMGLSTNEYCLCDLINRLCRNGDGWAYASRTYYADFLGISKRSIITMIQRLSDSGFVKKEDGKSRIKTTKKWLVKAENAGEESSPKPQKNDAEPVNFLHQNGELSSPDAVNFLHQNGELSSPNTKRDLKLYTKIRLKGEDVEIPEPLQTEKFFEAFSALLESKKWKNKSAKTVGFSLKKLSNYHVDFATSLVENAIMGDYQGVIFSDTETKYLNWQKRNDQNHGTFKFRSRETIDEGLEFARQIAAERAAGKPI